MNAAVVLFATVSHLNGVLSQVTVSIPGAVISVTAPPITTAVADTCTPTKSCSRPIFPGSRNICVDVGGAGTVSTECWDACDHTKSLQAYGGDPAKSSLATVQAIAMMVQAARTWQGLCPGEAWVPHAECNLGERCTAHTLNRGICTLKTVGTASVKECLDMCDTSIPITAYGHGHGEMSSNMGLVLAVRGNRDPQGETFCPTTTVWLWLWFPILLCCICGCGLGLWYAYLSWRRSVKNRNRFQKDDDYGDQEMPYYNQDYQQGQDMGGFDGQGDPYAGDYQQVSQEPMPAMDQQTPYPDMSREMAMADAGEMPVAPPLEAPPTQQQPPRALSQQVQQMQLPPTTAPGMAPPGAMAAPSTFYTSNPPMAYPNTVMPGGLPGRGGSMQVGGGSMYSQPMAYPPGAMPTNLSQRLA